MEKPRWDMVFQIVALSIAIGCERVIGLTTVWAHPHQAHFQTLEEMAHKHMLWADISTDWPCALIWLNDDLSHAPLLNEGHISTMTDGAPSMDAHSWLHQLQLCKLLQNEGSVVCPEGLNRELEALQFTFPQLPLWDAATPSEPSGNHHF